MWHVPTTLRLLRCAPRPCQVEEVHLAAVADIEAEIKMRRDQEKRMGELRVQGDIQQYLLYKICMMFNRFLVRRDQDKC